MSLTYQNNLGISVWLQQFLIGFKLTGALRQKSNFPPVDTLKTKHPIELNKIAWAAAQRFADRARKSGFKNGTLIRNESIEQKKEGWVTEPFPLSSTSGSFTLRGEGGI